jgi:uridylate kinase
VEGTPTDFIIDTRAEISVLEEPLEKLNTTTTTTTTTTSTTTKKTPKKKKEQNKTKQNKVVIATDQKPYSWTTDKKVNLRRSQVTHSFLNILECQPHCWA